MVSRWKFWTWPRLLQDLWDVLHEDYHPRLMELEKQMEMVVGCVRRVEKDLQTILSTRQDFNIRVKLLERRFDRLEELIKKEATTLRLGGDLAAVGEDFMKRFMADGQRYLNEYEDLLEHWRPK